jgi:branched-chain amino acid transport system ATP-binding protein
LILEVDQLRSGYFNKEVLHSINLSVGEREVVGIIGHNRAGKTTLLKTILGLLPIMEGTIIYQGKNITHQKSSINVEEGISYVPQGSGVSPDLKVIENLMLGGDLIQDKTDFQRAIDEVFDLFLRLKERKNQQSGTLSGGERQMLAIGIALIRKPKLMMLDEPSLGLAPILVQRVMKNILEINHRFGVTILLVEQNVKKALGVAKRIYVLKIGTITYEEKEVSKPDYGKLWKLF